MTNEQIILIREVIRNLINSHGEACPGGSGGSECDYLKDSRAVLNMLYEDQVYIEYIESGQNQALKAEVVDLRNKLDRLEQEFREVAAQSERFRQAGVASDEKRLAWLGRLNMLESGFEALRCALGCVPEADVDIVISAASHIAKKYSRIRPLINAVSLWDLVYNDASAKTDKVREVEERLAAASEAFFSGYEYQADEGGD
jgi:hypothetical protein